jgi:ATP-dependent 26S proteasome regulatory subunit
VEFSLPDLEGRTNIFKIHARSMSVEKVTVQIIFIITVLFLLVSLSLHTCEVSGRVKVTVLSGQSRLRFQRTSVSDTYFLASVADPDSRSGVYLIFLTPDTGSDQCA